jgi:hypothetical protein
MTRDKPRSERGLELAAKQISHAEFEAANFFHART